jgi:hypothetical protein
MLSWFYLGLFLLCMSVLMLQIVETRILSVVTYYISRMERGYRAKNECFVPQVMDWWLRSRFQHNSTG